VSVENAVSNKFLSRKVTQNVDSLGRTIGIH